MEDCHAAMSCSVGPTWTVRWNAQALVGQQLGNRLLIRPSRQGRGVEEGLPRGNVMQRGADLQSTFAHKITVNQGCSEVEFLL